MAKKKSKGMLSDKELNMIRGRAEEFLPDYQKRADDMKRLLEHIDALHEALDVKCDYEDALGTEGWRRYLGHPDSD